MSMITRFSLATAILLVLSTASLGFLGGRSPQPTEPVAGGGNPDPNMAMNDPDQLAWRFFAAVNQPARPGGYQAEWETWAEQEYVYSSCERPLWPTDPEFTGGPSSLVETLIDIANRQGVSDDFNTITGECNFQQVKLNRPFFEYIVNNNLWYQEGVIRAATTRGIHFPHEATVFKVDWERISESQKGRYHWRLISRKEWNDAMGEGPLGGQGSCSAGIDPGTSGEPILLGVKAFHLVSKSIDNWVWTTWNHADQLGRCDYIGCRDSFGVNPSTIAPHAETGLPYDPGRLTPAAVQLLDQAGIHSGWRHYRLMGTQVRFTDLTGRPTLLGNAVLEPGFGNSSSCMTCHAQSTINQSAESLDFLRSTNPFQGFVGVPDPSWYYPEAIGMAGPALPLMYQLDFMHQLHDQTESLKKLCKPSSESN